MIFDAIVAGCFFIGGIIVGVTAAVALLFTGWCYRWPRGVWK